MVNVAQYIRDIETEDPEHAALARQAVSRAEALSGGSFSNTEVASNEAMGDAAATCNMATNVIRLRQDGLDSGEALESGDTTHRLVHEQQHADGVSWEGEAELRATELTGRTPVDAYRENVRQARVLREVVGKDELRDLAVDSNANAETLAAYVRARMLDNLSSANDDEESLAVQVETASNSQELSSNLVQFTAPNQKALNEAKRIADQGVQLLKNVA